ncbi:hypothetical protein AB4072_06085 [Microvirga sp. 2MCAF38]|uniref:hypothetical protein n=1 Tax=Microvirga sp. 2MCAF38 TaxID=3232989 RepID=UPI003F9958EA
MTSDTRTCPRCARTVKAEDLVCRYCHHDFEAAAAFVQSSGMGNSILKIVALIAIPVVGFMIYLIAEEVSKTEHYATSMGMSVSECQTHELATGRDHSLAEKFCSRQVPKTGGLFWTSPPSGSGFSHPPKP